MVFTSTTAWEPRNVKIFQKIRNWQNWILSVPRVSICREKNRPGFVNISPTLVIDTSTERSSRVLQHENQKIWFFFFQKSSKLNSTCILTCAEELKSFKKVSTCTYMSTSGMHRRPFEGRHLVFLVVASKQLKVEDLFSPTPWNNKRKKWLYPQKIYSNGIEGRELKLVSSLSAFVY